MKLLITGGNGFIGKNIVEALSPRYTVIAPGRSELDLADEFAVRQFLRTRKIDVVIHGAVKPGHRNAVEQSGQLYSNTRMFFNLIRNADCFGKMIFLGSGAVYDQRNYEPNMAEDFFDVHVPADEHGFSKYIIAKQIEKLANVVELRLFGVFGKYEDYAIRFISNAITKALFDLPITIRQDRRFDYLFIDDLMPVLYYFIDHDARHKAYNVTPGKAVTLSSLAEMVVAVSGKSLPIRIAEPGFGMEYSGNNARLMAELPGMTFTAQEDAIQKLSTWYAENRHLLEKSKLLIDR